jgi:shikimate dehydrogenase
MKLYGLIGYPLIQSFSQPYFRNKFATEHIENADYLTFPIEGIHLFPEIITQHKNLVGLNVTIPYKEQVLQYVTHQTEVVQACGATNCLKINGNEIIAFNTDVIGFETSLKPLLEKYHHHALILGTGGAAKAVAYVLQKLGIEFLFVSRSHQNNTTIDYKAVNEQLLHKYTVIINASPSGMIPQENTFPDIPYQFLGKAHLLYDLVYKPSETIFLRNGKKQGAIVKNGFEMLELQAEAAWKIWNSDDVVQ